MDWICINQLELECIVGLRPDERTREQRVNLDIRLGAELNHAGRTGRIALTCDYDTVTNTVISLLKFRKYHLIEMAGEELAALLFAWYPLIEKVEIRIEKPSALLGRARCAAVEIKRERSDFPTRTDEEGGVEVTRFLATREAFIERVELATGSDGQVGGDGNSSAMLWLASGQLSAPQEPELSQGMSYPCPIDCATSKSAAVLVACTLRCPE